MDPVSLVDPVSLDAVLSGIRQPWSPRTVATVNDYDVRLFKAEGEFTRHAHPATDELFLVLEGELTIRLDDGEVVLRPGELYVVPRGTAHQPFSSTGASCLLLEPSGTLNTGDAPGPLTADRTVI